MVETAPLDVSLDVSLDKNNVHVVRVGQEDTKGVVTYDDLVKLIHLGQ